MPRLMRFFAHAGLMKIFLALTGALALLIALFARPAASGALAALAGLAVLSLSRGGWGGLIRRGRVRSLWWLAAEAAVCVAVMTAVGCLLSPERPAGMQAVAGGMLFFLVSVQLLPALVAWLLFCLGEARSEVARLAALLDAPAVAGGSAGSAKVDFYDKGGRLTFAARLEDVLFIEAADNYTNIHYVNDDKEETFILHNSMKEIESRYADRGLVRCQRGFMVNLANVKLMRKEPNGFSLELNHSTRRVPVSKSYADNVMRHFTGAQAQQV